MGEVGSGRNLILSTRHENLMETYSNKETAKSSTEKWNSCCCSFTQQKWNIYEDQGNKIKAKRQCVRTEKLEGNRYMGTSTFPEAQQVALTEKLLRKPPLEYRKLKHIPGAKAHPSTSLCMKSVLWRSPTSWQHRKNWKITDPIYRMALISWNHLHVIIICFPIKEVYSSLKSVVELPLLFFHIS